MPKQNTSQQTKSKFALFFLILLLGFLIFIVILFDKSSVNRRLPALQTSETNLAIRGDIISADGYKLATSKKLFKVMVDTRNIDPDKKDLFVNLYSIYSGDSKEKVKKIIDSRVGNVVFSYKINQKRAEYLQSLARKLYRFGVFKSYIDPETGVASLQGMSISESGEVRIYPYLDTLSPIVGYVKKVENNAITQVKGVKGIERSYEDRLAPIQNSYIKGSRDIASTIILNKDTRLKARIDGQSLQLTIPLKLQKGIENIIDSYKLELDAKEIIVIIMRSDNGDILSLASSNRYIINSITQDDYAKLNISAVEYAYEPGSVMKPIIYAMLLERKKIEPYELVRGYGGAYKIGKHTIKDEKPYDWFSAEDTVIYSSNIGISQLAQKLSASEYIEGLGQFGFLENSGLDLFREDKGFVPTVQALNTQIYKATVSYGYGLKVNFMQLVKAFNVINNNGVLVKPRLVKNIIDKKKGVHEVKPDEGTLVLSKEVARIVKNTLIKAIEKGTGKNAFVEGIEVGGKTGTAHLTFDGDYQNIYTGSFIGFANDKNSNKYTIGILTIEPKKQYKYFGAQSAAPIFKKVVELMIEEKYLMKSNNL